MLATLMGRRGGVPYQRSDDFFAKKVKKTRYSCGKRCCSIPWFCHDWPGKQITSHEVQRHPWWYIHSNFIHNNFNVFGSCIIDLVVMDLIPDALRLLRQTVKNKVLTNAQQNCWCKSGLSLTSTFNPPCLGCSDVAKVQTIRGIHPIWPGGNSKCWFISENSKSGFIGGNL